MATSSVDLLSVIPGISVSASDILQAELLLSQVLTAQDPTLDTRTGTAIRDMAIRPNATLLATINKALVYYWTQNSLSNVDNTTPTAFVDKLMQNYFMSRFSGNKTVINARLFFAKQTTISIGTDMFFSTDNILRFFPVSSATYGANQLTFDPSTNQYYLSIDLVAESSGLKYNISRGSLIYFTNFNPFFLHAEINYISALATDSETNLQFIDRAKNTISTRNLINTPSISSNLLQNFPMISNITSIGMGDKEMLRDKALVTPPSILQPIWIHLGGATDIYTKVPLTSSVMQFNTDAYGKISLTGPIYKVVVSSTAGGPNPDTIPAFTPFVLTNDFSTSVTPQSITRAGTVVTVKITNHGLTAGERFTVKGADQSSYNGTFTVNSVLDSSHFTYLISSIPATPATGNLLVSMVTRGDGDVGFSAKQSLTVDFSTPASSIVPGGVSWAAGVVSAIVTNHGFSTGDVVTISGLPAYNGTHTVTVLSPDTFTFPDATNSTPMVTTGGTAQRLRNNQSVSLILYYFQGIDGIQTYLEDVSNRVLAASQLARGFNITLLDIGIVGYGGISPDQAVATKVLTKYLEGLAPGQAFIMADALSALYAAGVTTIQTPLSITYVKHHRDLFPETFGIITDALNPNDRTNVFMLNSVTTSSTIL